MRWLGVAGLVIAACSTTRTPPAAPPIAREPFPEIAPFRLPHTFEPTSYRVELALGDGRFTGHIEITGELSEEASLIWLHAVDLEVSRATATRGNLSVPLDVSPPRSDQVIGFRADRVLAPGRWTLAIDYRGLIRDQEPVGERFGMPNMDAWAFGVFRRMVGTREYIFTHGEPAFARRMFPCIDEPDRKVPWQLTLVVDRALVAASNTAIVRETPITAHRKRVEFAVSRPLPSYLIAFAVGPFDVIEAGASKSGVPIRILVPRDSAADAPATAAKLAPRLLDLLEDWFGIPYPYGKLDLVAVPHFGWGGMENAGLVALNETGLDNDRLILHELAHQWFGNLVTLRWWNDMWLNESFTEWLVDKLADHVGGEPDDDVTGAKRGALTLLASEPTAIRASVTHAAALELEQFNARQSTSRGVALLQLIEANVGAETFRDAVRGHLTKHAHGTAATEDLVSALNRATNQNLEGAITGLLDHAPPVIEARLACVGGVASLLVDPIPWEMPLCVAYDRDGTRAEHCAMVDATTREIALPSTSCARWVMPNRGGVGLYQTRWTPALVDPLLATGWAALTTNERKAVFEELDDRVLELRVLARHLDDPTTVPWLSELHVLRDVARFIPADLRSRFDAWVLARLGSRVRALHFKLPEGSSFNTTRELIRVMDVVASTRDPQLVREAKLLAANYPALPPDSPFTSAVLTLAASNDPAFLIRLLDDLATAPMDRRTILEALASIPSLLEVLAREPSRFSRLARGDQGALVHHLMMKTCTPTARAGFVALAQKLPDARLETLLGGVDRCIAKHAPLEPAIRAWLGTAKAPRRAP